MPKLPNRTITYRAEDQSYYSHEAEVGVDSEGVFYIRLPAELVDVAEQLKNSMRGTERVAWYGIPSRWNMREKHSIFCKVLDDGIAFFKTCAAQHLRTEVIRDRVICYDYSAQVAFWIDKDTGLIESNGCIDSQLGRKRKGDWWKPRNKDLDVLSANDTTDTYSIGLAAEVYDRAIYKRTSGDNVVFTTVKTHETDDVAIKALNSWTGLCFEPSHAKIMPYTPERAMFFHNMMRAMCGMARSMDEFFNRKDLIERIDNGGRLLLYPTPESKPLLVRGRTRAGKTG
jgi:hypothetical protein